MLKADTKREWYAIQTKPNQEQIAKLNYKMQGYQVYLPLVRTTIRHARQIKEKLVAFFPGYLFLHLSPNEQNWTAISSTRGALKPVYFGNEYVPVPDWLILALQAREDKRGNGIINLKEEKLIPGSKIEVLLTGDETASGIVCSHNGSQNIKVLLDLLGRQVKTTVSLERICICW